MKKIPQKLTLLFTLLFFLISSAVFAEQVLHFGTAGEPGSLDPHKISGTWENDIVGNVFLGLMTEDAKSNTVPGNAASYKLSNDKKVYTFKLRDNKWSDGVPVTAYDFEFGFRRIMDPGFNAEYASILYPIKNAKAIKSGEIKDINALGVKALDSKTLEITLDNPTPYFLNIMKHFTSFPIPKHAVEKFGDDWIKPENMVTNGPFVIREWIPNTHVMAVKNSNFYDAANVKIDKVYFYPTEDRSAALKKFRNGELHYNDDIPSDQIDWIKQNLKGEYITGPYIGIYFYPMNVRLPKLGTREIRHALSKAVNREVITEKVLKSGEVPAYGYVPPLNGFKLQSVPYKGQPYNKLLAEAKKTMTSLGYSKDKPLKLQLRYNTSENHKKIAVAISAMWKQIYVETELLNSDVAVHYDEIEKHKFEVARAAWVADYGDPQNFLFLLMTGDPQNYSQYSNSDFDALMKKSETISGAERAQTLEKAEKIMLNDLPMIPIYYYVFHNLVSKKLKGYEPNSENIHRVRFMSLK